MSSRASDSDKIAVVSRIMSKINEISLATPPAIHVGPILTPGSNKTISIVIPLSAQVATIPIPKIEKSCKDCGKDGKQQQVSNGNSSRVRNDKAKGCPFPNCVRYGRAFSRAHDLKRHIARHEMKKEKLSDMNRQQNDTKEAKKCGQESKFQDDLFVQKNKSVCPICSTEFQANEELQEHMKQHTMNILQEQKDQEKTEVLQKDLLDNKEDDFLLEEMLLLNKNPRHKEKTSSLDSKIRCDYCSKTFKTKWTLSSHVAAHEGRFQFDCNQCGKKFVRKSHYEGHVRSHEAARPYVCEQCGKTFKELKHRREHTKRKHPANQNAIQTLLDSIGPCASEELPVDQAKFTLLMPINFTA